MTLNQIRERVKTLEGFSDLFFSHGGDAVLAISYASEHWVALLEDAEKLAGKTVTAAFLGVSVVTLGRWKRDLSQGNLSVVTRYGVLYMLALLPSQIKARRAAALLSTEKGLTG